MTKFTKPLFDILITSLEQGREITYGDAANRLRSRYNLSLYSRGVGKQIGILGHLLWAVGQQHGINVPPLSVIVVNETTRQPSSGLGPILIPWLVREPGDRARMIDEVVRATGSRVDPPPYAVTFAMTKVRAFTGWRSIASLITDTQWQDARDTPDSNNYERFLPTQATSPASSEDGGAEIIPVSATFSPRLEDDRIYFDFQNPLGDAIRALDFDPTTWGLCVHVRQGEHQERIIAAARAALDDPQSQHLLEFASAHDLARAYVRKTHLIHAIKITPNVAEIAFVATPTGPMEYRKIVDWFPNDPRRDPFVIAEHAFAPSVIDDYTSRVFKGVRISEDSGKFARTMWRPDLTGATFHIESVPLQAIATLIPSKPMADDYRQWASARGLLPVPRDPDDAPAPPQIEVSMARAPIARVQASAMLRPGQGQFRRQVMQLFGRRCAITACDDPLLLNAAHIVTYPDGFDDNSPENGLLLTIHMHVLFDAGRLVLLPEGKQHRVRITGALASADVAAAQDQLVTLPACFAHRVVAAARRASVEVSLGHAGLTGPEDPRDDAQGDWAP
jgi:hypothetical protein